MREYSMLMQTFENECNCESSCSLCNPYIALNSLIPLAAVAVARLAEVRLVASGFITSVVGGEVAISVILCVSPLSPCHVDMPSCRQTTKVFYTPEWHSDRHH